MKTVDIVFVLLLALSALAFIASLVMEEIRRRQALGDGARVARNGLALMRLARSMEAAARDVRTGGPGITHDELRGWAAACRGAAADQFALANAAALDSSVAAEAGPLHLGDLPAGAMAQGRAHARA